MCPCFLSGLFNMQRGDKLTNKESVQAGKRNKVYFL